MTENTVAPAGLAPIAVDERIHALDIVRGFALVGIFLMNIEWFTRPISELGTGVDATQTGLHYAASWFVYTFVQGKFWTLFSLLFGMGFAVMLTRAEQGGREFIAPYVRRIAGLFVFGAAHFILLWPGDILHNYAITALVLLLIVSRSWKAWIALVLSVVAAALLAGDPPSMALPLALLALTALLMYFLNRGALARYWKFGATLYLLPIVLGTIFIITASFVPQIQPEAPTAEQRSERALERAEKHEAEVAVYQQPSYFATVAYRAKKFREELPSMAGLSFGALPLFILGFWFMRAGVMARLQEHRALFRKLCLFGLPLGLAITLASVSLNPTFVPGTGRQTPVALARILFEMGTLPLTMGYFGGLILMLQTRLGGALLSPLRFAGRMALTNYLGASLISAFVFHGWGLGYFGEVPRAGQVLFVLAVFTLQLAFSALWLSRFRYGPMEWLWRAITYWQLPAMRRQSTVIHVPAVA